MRRPLRCERERAERGQEEERVSEVSFAASDVDLMKMIDQRPRSTQAKKIMYNRINCFSALKVR